MNYHEIIEIAAICAGIAATVALEHITVGRSWKRYEWSRRALGIATVLGWLLFAALAGTIDLITWTIILIGFVVAGIVVWWFYIQERIDAAKRAQRELDDGKGGGSGPGVSG